MNQQKTKYRIKKDMDSFKERVRMKEETTTPKKLLSHKGAIACSKHNSRRSHIFSGATTPINVRALCSTMRMASVNARRASLSSFVSAFMTGNAL